MTEQNESQIHTHAVDPEEPFAKHYMITLVTAAGQLTQVIGMDKAAPRDVARRAADMRKRFLELLAERFAARGGKQHVDLQPFWHEPLLEGDENGDGYVVVTDPRTVLSVATPPPPLEFEDDLEDEDEEQEEEEETPEEPAPKPSQRPFRLPAGPAKK